MNNHHIGEGSPAPAPPDPELHKRLRRIGIGIIATLFVLAAVTWKVNLFDVGLRFDAGPTALVVAFVYLALSLPMIDADEMAGAFFYGKALAVLHPGLNFVPFLLMQVKRTLRTVQQFQAPGEPEKVFKDDDIKDLPPGMVRPIRAVTRAPDPSKGEDKILDAQMTLTLSFTVQYQVNNIFPYVANFGYKEALEIQLRDIGEATLAEQVVQHTPRTFIEALPEVNKLLASETEARFKNSGVDILSVRLISPDVSHRVSSALAGIPEERAKAEQAKVKAAGEKVRKTLEGEGDAAAAQAMLIAQAEGGKAMMDKLKVGGDAVLASEAVRGLSDKTDVLVVGAEGGMKDVMGLVKGAQAALNSTTKGTSP